MTTPDTLVLTRSDVAALLDLDSCIEAVELAFARHAAGETLPPGVLGLHAPGGGFHVKTAGLHAGRGYAAVKANANFPANPSRRGLPTIQGAVLLFDLESGVLLAVMDSIEITILRTGAATAVAARRLARQDASVVTICGCGAQGRVQLRALTRVRPVRLVHAYDIDADAAVRFARAEAAALGIDVRAAGDLRAALAESDLCVTCTPSRTPLIGREDVRPGTFIAAVGADAEHKQELDAGLVAASTLVADLADQCAAIGELHHAIARGLMRRDQVHAELADVVSERRPGRTRADEIVIFDSTGTALQDVAAASAVYERACASGVGLRVRLGA
jgi:alanine dehydrogenase